MPQPARKFEPFPEEEKPQLQIVEAPAYVHQLFDDSLMESGAKLRTQRGWTVLVSFVLQVLFLGVMILMPLIFIQDLPKPQLLGFLVAPPPPPPPPAPAAAQQVRAVIKQVESDIMDGRLRQPTHIPEKVKMLSESEAPPPIVSSGGVVGGVPGGIPGGTLGGVLGGIIGSTSKGPEIKSPSVAPPRIRVSQGVSRGLLVERIEPVYPPIARNARIQGQVLLRAIISRDGTIQDLRVVSGHPLLVQAAIEAVKQWRYKPYLLNGAPVEVDTEIMVDFRLTS